MGTRDYIPFAVKLDCNFTFMPMQAVRELVHPSRPDWYKEFYAKAMDTMMRSYEAQVRRFVTLHSCLYKVSWPNSVTYFKLMPICGWRVVRCRSMNEHQTVMCLKRLDNALKIFEPF